MRTSKCNKHKIKNWFFILGFIISLLYISCDYFSTGWEYIPYYYGQANLIVYNLTTDDKAEYEGKYGSYATKEKHVINVNNTVSIGEETNSDTLVFHIFDSLRLEFIPPAAFINSRYEVNYMFLDKNITITEEPYIVDYIIHDDIPLGLYDIDCDAMSSDWDKERSRCFNTCVISIE